MSVQDQQLQSLGKTIKRRDQYMLLFEQTMADIEGQLPDELLTKSALSDKKKRPCGFSNHLTRVRVELTLTDEEKAGASATANTPTG